MKRIALAAVLSAVALGPGAAPPPRAAVSAPGRTVLEGASLRLVLSAEGGARLAEVYSKRQRRNLIDARSATPLYQLEAYRTGRSALRVDASQADTTRIETPAPGTARVISRHDTPGLEVVSTIVLGPRDEEARFTIAIQRDARAQDRIDIVRYPGFPVPVAGPGVNILLPVADGLRVRDPAANMRDGEARCYDYPGIASAQLMAVYDRTGGIAGYPADAEGNTKRLCARRQGGDALIYTEHVVSHQTGERIVVPYPVVVGAFEGGWERAADFYKTWAGRQAWCSASLTSRNLPAAAAAPSFFLGVNVRSVAGGQAESINRIPGTPSLVAAWKEFLGMPVSALLFGWEKHGPWVTPDAFPPFGGEDSFGRLISALHQDDNRAVMFLSGLNVTIEKSARNGAPSYRIDAAGLARYRQAAVVKPDGQVLIEGTPEGEGVGAHLVLCPATPLAREVLTEGVKKCLRLGADVVQIDQVVGGGTPPCFAANHGHPAGGGTTVYARLAGLLDELTAMAKSAPRPAVLSLEEPGELYLPHVQLFHCREYAETVWPRDRPGSVGVPLFAYLYHEFLPGYGGDSAPLAVAGEDPSVALYAQAINLATGRLPGAAVWMKTIPPASLHPDLARFVKDAAALWRGEAGRYLLAGRLVDLGVDGSGSRRVTTRIAGRSYSFEVPAALSRGFRLEDGTLGALYVNAGPAPVTVRLGFGPRADATADPIWPAGGPVLRAGQEQVLAPRSILFARVRR